MVTLQQDEPENSPRWLRLAEEFYAREAKYGGKVVLKAVILGKVLPLHRLAASLPPISPKTFVP